MFILSLLAQGGRPGGSPFERPEIIWGTAGLAGALLVGAAVVYFVDRWRKQAAIQQKADGAELTEFREMYARGEITEEEYAKLRLKVAQRVKPPTPAGPATPGPSGTEPGPPPSPNGTPPA